MRLRILPACSLRRRRVEAGSVEAWTAEAKEVEGRAGVARAAAEERRRQAAAAASRIVVVIVVGVGVGVGVVVIGWRR